MLLLLNISGVGMENFFVTFRCALCQWCVHGEQNSNVDAMARGRCEQLRSDIQAGHKRSTNGCQENYF